MVLLVLVCSLLFLDGESGLLLFDREIGLLFPPLDDFDEGESVLMLVGRGLVRASFSVQGFDICRVKEPAEPPLFSSSPACGSPRPPSAALTNRWKVWRLKSQSRKYSGANDVTVKYIASNTLNRCSAIEKLNFA